MRSDAMKAAHPNFEPTIVGTDILHVIDLADHPDARSKIDRTVSDAHFLHGSTQRLSAVCAENDIACRERFERSADIHLVSLL